MTSDAVQLRDAAPWEKALAAVYHSRFGHLLTDRQYESVRLAALRVAEEAQLDVKDYVSLLASLPTASPLVQALLAPSTNKESYFFRDSTSTESLRRHVIPELIRRSGASKVLRVWSAGCSTGEEIYTVSILLSELLPPGEAWSVTLLGTDIDQGALQLARRAEYRDWSLRSTQPSERTRFFNHDRSAGTYTLRSAFRSGVHFDTFNLAEEGAPIPAPGTFDLILCRNVSIYFSAEAQTRLARNLQRALSRHGVWVGGASDPLPGRSFETTVYPGLLSHSIASRSAEPPAPSPRAASTLKKSSSQPAPRERQPRSVDIIQAAALPSPRERRQPRSPSTDRRVASVANEPHQVAHLNQRARELGDRGELEQARLLLKKALKLDPTAIETHLVSAMVHQADGDLSAALEDYRRALYLEPHRAETYLRVGLLLMNLQRNDEAVKALRNAMVTATNDPEGAELRNVAGRQLARLVGAGNGE